MKTTSPAQRRILRLLAGGSWWRVRDVGVGVERSTTATYTVLGGLVRRGLVERSPAGWRMAPGLVVNESGDVVGRLVWCEGRA